MTEIFKINRMIQNRKQHKIKRLECKNKKETPKNN